MCNYDSWYAYCCRDNYEFILKCSLYKNHSFTHQNICRFSKCLLEGKMKIWASCIFTKLLKNVRNLHYRCIKYIGGIDEKCWKFQYGKIYLFSFVSKHLVVETTSNYSMFRAIITYKWTLIRRDIVIIL